MKARSGMAEAAFSLKGKSYAELTALVCAESDVSPDSNFLVMRFVFDLSFRALITCVREFNTTLITIPLN